MSQKLSEEARQQLKKRVTDKLMLLATPGQNAATVTAIVGAPLVCLAAMEIQFALVPFACWYGWKPALHVTTAVALLMVAAFGYLGLRNWHSAGKTAAGDTDAASDRTRFLGLIGIGSSVVSGLAIVGQAIANLILNPCS